MLFASERTTSLLGEMDDVIALVAASLYAISRGSKEEYGLDTWTRSTQLRGVMFADLREERAM